MAFSKAIGVNSQYDNINYYIIYVDMQKIMMDKQITRRRRDIIIVPKSASIIPWEKEM